MSWQLPALAAGLAWLAYVLVIYPLLLWALAKWWPRPVRRGRMEPEVTLILAVHNGVAHLEAKLSSIAALDYPVEKLKLVVVSDGSTDGSEEVARHYAARFPDRSVEVISVERGGKPRALNAGLALAESEIVAFTDVRQTLEATSLRFLVENFADPEVGVVSGSLFIRRGGTDEEEATGIYWRYERWLRESLSLRDSIFGATGAYYAMRRHLAAPLPESALLDDMHLPLRAFFSGYRLVLDSRARMFDDPTGIDEEFWRKVRTLAGNYQILVSYPRLLLPGWMGGNRMWWHFLSYKFGRLLLPLALASVIGGTLGLPVEWRNAAWLAMGFACLLAWVAPRLPSGPWRKLGAPLRSFAALMLATTCAPFWLLLPPERRWKARKPQSSMQG